VAGRHETIADILMGAAHADQHLDGRELEKVRQLLVEATGGALSTELSSRLDTFEPAGFDVATAVASLGLTDEGDKRHLLELVAAVHDSDDVWDLDEDAYLRDVAQALGLATADFADLTVAELEIEDIGAALLPPPLPDASGGGPPPLPA
jgi:tellurite resistance protein